MLHETVHGLLSRNPTGHVGGPWWFLEAWVSLYTTKITDFLNLTNNKFPYAKFAKGDEVVSKSCTSFSEATISSPGDNLSIRLFAYWFGTLYSGPEKIALFAYNMVRRAVSSSPSRFLLRISWVLLTL
jgi:hypothetical protein